MYFKQQPQNTDSHKYYLDDLAKPKVVSRRLGVVEHQLALSIRFKTRTSVAQNLILTLTGKLTAGSLPLGEDHRLQLLIHSTSSRQDPIPGL